MNNSINKIKKLQLEADNNNNIIDQINNVKESKIKIVMEIQKKYRKKGTVVNGNIVKNNNYGFIDFLLINELVLNLKRKLFNNDVSEILDYCDSLLLNGMILNTEYSRLYSIFFKKSDQFINNNLKYYSDALEIIFQELLLIPLNEIKLEEKSNENILNFILKNFPKEYSPTGNEDLNEILIKLMTYKDFSFYYSQKSKLIVQNEISNINTNIIIRSEGILYDPYNDEYGKGYLFKVYRFKSENYQPAKNEVFVEATIPKTGQKITKKVVTEIKGNTPFIKLNIFNPQFPEETIFVWKQIKENYVKMYPVSK